MRLADLCLLNARLRGAPEGFGLRAEPVHCVSRDGRLIHFAAAETVASSLDHCLRVWDAQFAASRGPMEIAAACARFWLAFIAIHPFQDKNGATGRAFLREELERRGLSIRSFHWLDRCLLEGDAAGDLKNLTHVFLLTIAFKEKHA